ncbi:MAG TPA: WD40 repeat domain-containing protein [Pirellulales bacterium]|nr:WD40 repeat domain-containing protein [Pirellulales bacterium]
MTTVSANSSIAPTSSHSIPTMSSKGYWQCECGKTLRFALELAGKKGRCPACSRRFVIPSLAPVEGAFSTLRGHTGPIRAVAFSPDRRLVATAAEVASPAAKSELAEAFLWDVNSAIPLARLHWHRNSIAALAFSPDGRVLATAGKDHAISIWNVERGLWDTVIGVHEWALYGHQAAVTAVAFSPTVACLVTAATDQTLRFWDPESWTLIRTINVGRTGEGRIAFSPCGRYLASVWSSRGPATIWNAANGERHLELRLPVDEDSADTEVGFSPDGSRLIVLSEHQVRLWDISTCQVLASFEAPGTESLAVSPRTAVIATGGYDAETGANVSLWDAASLARTREFGGHGQPVSAVAFSCDGKMLVSGGRDGVANVWEVG